MRAALALVLAVAVLALSGATHVHAADHESPRCVACAAPRATPVAVVAVDLAPAPVVEALVAPEPGLAPVTGAPLGAIPGQSPPVA